MMTDVKVSPNHATFQIWANISLQDVFLVGGFGESEYLKEEIRFSMEQVRDVNVRVPDTA
jgi:hypothetical protein